MGFFTFGAFAQEDCEIGIAVAPISQGDGVPVAIASRLDSKIRQILSQNGIAGAPENSQFFAAGRFDKAYHDELGGTSPKTVLKTTLTLYIGDADGQKVFASKAIDLKGVGTSEERAYQMALNSLKPDSKAVQDFVTEGKRKIIAYYDAKYPQILAKANTALKQRDYPEALYWASQIPDCCKGFEAANELMVKAYQEEVDAAGKQLLMKAQGAFSADPTAVGAAKASEYLSQIDPAASCMPQAEELAKKMEAVTKAQWKFENVDKYRDKMAMHRHMIDASKAAAVAKAKSRPNVVYNYEWLH